MKTEIVKLRVTPELKEQLKSLAESKHRSVSNYIEMLILRDVAENCKEND